MPAPARDVVPAWVPDPVESGLASAQVPGTGRQVFAISHTGAGKSVLAGFDLTDGEQVYTSAGSSAQRARFGDAVGFVDQNQDLLGVFGADGTVSKRLSDTPAGALPSLMATEPRPATGTGVERVRWTNQDGSAGSGTVG